MSDFSLATEARRLGVSVDIVVKSTSPSNGNKPGNDIDVSKPVGSSKPLFPFGGMPRS